MFTVYRGKEVFVLRSPAFPAMAYRWSSASKIRDADAVFISSADMLACAEGIRVRVAGLLVMHQAPQTAKGFRFLTLEDEDGFINVVIRPDVYPRYKRIIREHPLLIVDGIIERQGVVVNVVARVVVPVSI